RGHSARLEQNALKGRTFRQGGGDCFRHGWRPDLKNDLPVPIDDADRRLFHRDVQSGKILHGCSLLFTSESRYYRLSGSSRHYPMLKNTAVQRYGSRQSRFEALRESTLLRARPFARAMTRYPLAHPLVSISRAAASSAR